MSAEADAMCGAGYGERSQERVNRRNGYRERDWDTRAGTVELAIPKLRSGSYFPEWLLERRRRAEQALISVVATSYLLGVSTRRVDKLVEQLGIKGISKSQVSRDVEDPGRPGRRVPEPGPGRRPVLLRLGGRPHPEGPRGRPDRQRARPGRHRRERRWAPGDPRGRGRPHPRTAPAGWRSCAAWSPGACPECSSSSPMPTAASSRRSERRCRGGLAAMPHALPAESADEGPEVRPAVGRHPGADHLRPARRRRGPCPARPRGGQSGGQISRRRRPSGRGQGRPAGLHRLPARDLAADLVQQSPRTTEQRDPPTHRRGRDLPRPGRDHPPGRRGADGTDRRMDRSPPLHGPGIPRQSTPTRAPRRNAGPRTPPSKQSPLNLQQRITRRPTHTPLRWT